MKKEKEVAAATKAETQALMRQHARAQLVNALDLYAQAYGGEAISEEEANKLAEEIAALEDSIAEVIEQLKGMNKEDLQRLKAMAGFML